MAKLGEEAERRFVRAQVGRLTAAYPDRLRELGVEESSLETFVRLGISRAASYRIQYEADVEAYLDFMVELGPNFDTDPARRWAAQILNRPYSPGTAKVNEISEILIFTVDLK